MQLIADILMLHICFTNWLDYFGFMFPWLYWCKYVSRQQPKTEAFKLKKWF